ncbi:hypothetical protein SOI81_02645 [Acinetobacter pittii]|uniref:hypothetical protein n=1 Tax=Acinetobacter pittii TaxID=48296 RepID=UPI002A6A843D|nr:hypothetical protein [Acinetobacter pittii]WPP70578.1 hypothetical protein SOI81_02645 [Acinetobacter pittii]
MTVPVNDLTEIKNNAIALLKDNKREIQSLFEQLTDYFNIIKKALTDKDIKNFKDLNNYFQSDIKIIIERLIDLNDIDLPSLNFIIRKSKKIYEVVLDLENLIKDNKFDEKLWSISIDIIDSNITDMKAYINKVDLVQQFQLYKDDAEKIINELKTNHNELAHKIEQVDIINDDLKNKKVHEIFADDSEKFKMLAKRYEIAFYFSLALLFLYFFGWYIEINTTIFKFKLAEQFYENHSTIFYIQKISLLILSTTLAAFLLKRSFMNRRLADEAYRTAKELDALPRYMEGMPDEMKEKIRFDLAYKYFGNGIHHESYTGGENLMHENIKANTDFIKAVKNVKTPDSGKANS